MDIATLGLRVDASGAIVQTSQLDASLARLGGTSDTLLPKLGRIAVGFGSIAGAAAAMIKSVRDAQQFEAQMALVSSIVDDASVSIDGLRDSTLAMFRDLPVKSLDDLSKGLYEVISAGVPAGDAVAYLGVAARAAIAGVTSTATAVDALTTATNSWRGMNLSAQDAADQMFQTVNKGKITFEELASSIGFVAPVAAAYKISLADVLGATAQLTAGGMSASVAMVGIRSAIANIIKPTGDLADKFPELAKEFNAAKLEAVGFTKFLIEFNEAAGGSKEALNALFTDIQGKTAVFSLLTDGGAKVAEQMHAIENATGAADNAFGKATDTSAALNQQLRNELTATLTELGDSALPAVNAGLQAMLVPLRLIGQHTGEVAEAVTLVAAIFAARWLVDAAERLQLVVKGFTLARAETVAYAENTLRTAAAERARATATLAGLEADRAAILASRELAVARLAAANASIGSLVHAAPDKSIQQALADSEKLVIADRARRDATRDLAQLGQQQARVQAALSLETAALAASTTAAATAQTALATTTSLTTRAMAALTPIARTMWAAIGGPIGATLIALYAFYKLFIDTSGAMEAFAKRVDDTAKKTDEYAKSLGSMTLEAVKAAEAQERLNAALIAAQLAQQSTKLVGLRDEVLDLRDQDEGGAALVKQRELSKELDHYNSLLNTAAEITGRIGALVDKRVPLEEASNRAADDAAKIAADVARANEERVRLARQAIDMVGLEGRGAALLQVEQRAINDAMKARAELSGKDLSATLASIEATRRLGVEAVKLGESHAKGEKAQRDAMDALDKINARIRERLELDAKYLANVNARARENGILSAQVQALSESADAYQRVIVLQAQQAAVEKAQADANGTLSSQQLLRIREQVAEHMRLLRVLEALRDLNGENPFTIPDATTKGVGDMADGISRAVGAAQGLAAAFGDVGREVGAALGQVAQLATSVARLQQAGITTGADGKQKNVGIGGALSGAAGIAGTANAVGAVLAIGGAIVSLAEAAGLFRDKAAEAQRALDDFNRALADFAVKTGTSLEQQLAENLRKAEALALDGAKNLKVNVAGFSVKSADELEAFIATIPQVGGAIGQWRRELELLLPVLRDNEAAIKAAAELAKAQFAEDQQVRQLRALGRNQEADALQQQIDDMREMQGVIDEFGNSFEAATLRVTQALERMRREIKAAEDERRGIADNNLDALRFTGNRREIEDAEVAEEQARRVWDAIFEGASEAELAAIAFRNAAQLAAIEARRLEEDTRTRESLVTRALSAMGNTRGAEDAGLAARQRQEMVDAIKEGMTPSNLALLQFTQFLEREQIALRRRIEDGTKAIEDMASNDLAAIDLLIDATRSFHEAEMKRIDEQIAAIRAGTDATVARLDARIGEIRDATKAQTERIDEQIAHARNSLEVARDQLAATQKLYQTTEKAVEALQQFRQALPLGELSPLSPEDKLAEAKMQYDALLARAQGGDATAASELPAAAQAFLEASKAYNAFGAGFVDDFQRVQGEIGAVTAQFEAQLTMQEQALRAAEATVEGIDASINAMQQTKDAITKAAEREIAVLQDMKQKAQDDAKKEIKALEDQKDVLKERFDKTIEVLNAQKDEIRRLADEKTAELIQVETDAFNELVRQHEYFETFSQLTEQGNAAAAQFYDDMREYMQRDDDTFIERDEGGAIPVRLQEPAPRSTEPDPQIAILIEELKATRRELAAALDKNSRVTAAAGGETVDALQRIEQATEQVVTETRFARGQGQRAGAR